MNKEVHHIGFVSNTSWSMYNFRLGVLRHFIRKGYQVTVLAPRDSYSDKLIAEGINYIHIPLNNYSTNLFWDLRLLFFLQRIYKMENFDFIFHYTIKPIIYGSIAAKRKRIPSIAITTGMGRTFQFGSKTSQALVNRIYRYATSECKEIWALNQGDKAQLVQAAIATEDRIRILPSEGINIKRFRPSQFKTKKAITRFLFAGRLLIDKGIREYIKAAEQIKKDHSHVKFEILGFLNPKNDNCISESELLQAQELGTINYLGSTEDIRPYLDRADCVVFPSFYNEGISRILMEAACMATPIITSDQEGCRELVIRNKSGYLCIPGDTADLIDKLDSFLLLSEEDRILMGQIGKAHITNNFKEENVLKIYDQVIVKELGIHNSKTSNQSNHVK